MRIFVIPDLQVKDGVDTRHIDWLAQYAVEKKPDVIVNIGDWADMPSLSSYDVGKKSFEGRQYTKDIEAVNETIYRFVAPIHQETARLAKNKRARWNPRMLITIGNHEDRIDRAIENDRKLEGLISINDLDYAAAGFEVYQYLEPVVINGVAFCHYFPSGAMGRPSATATAQLNKQHMSCVAGHQQGFQMATGKRGDGKLLTSIIAGSCYLHEENYMGAFGNRHYRGALMLHDVEDGEFTLNMIPLKHLEAKYG